MTPVFRVHFVIAILTLAACGGGGGGGDGGGAPALTVNAGADQTVDPGQTVTLRALSSDPAATISWSIYSGQTLPLVDNGAEVTFESPDVICPTGIGSRPSPLSALLEPPTRLW